MEQSRGIHFRNRREWRSWLARNHAREESVWLIHHKKNSGKKGLTHPEAVEEAICYGWVDSQLRSIDIESFALRYTPRRKRSVWSQINKDTAMRMIAEGKMTKAGLTAVEEARKSGKWASAYSSRVRPTVQEDLRNALEKDKVALRNFDRLSNSHQVQYIFWVDGAKRAVTRERRIAEVVKRMRQSA